MLASPSNRALSSSLRILLRGTVAAAILLLTLLSPLGCLATIAPPRGPRQKDPWAWTVDERLRARFDAQAAAERRTKRATEPYGFRSVEANPPEVNVVIGRRNPELLLPWEIFSYLIDTAYAPDQGRSNQFRRAFEAGGPLPPELWDRLASCLVRYLSERDSEEALLPRDSGGDRVLEGSRRTQIQELHRQRCATRQLALTCARQQFGDRVFDRFLYQRVAPRVFRFWDGDAASLRFIEGGCR